MNDREIEHIEEIVRPEIHFCTFTVGGKRLSVPVKTVKEIVDAVDILPLPGSPEYIIGLIHLRGTVIPVVDIALIYEQTYGNTEKKLLIIESSGEYISFMTDGMPDLTEDRDGELIDTTLFFDRYRIK